MAIRVTPIRPGAIWAVENLKGERVYTIEKRGNYKSRIRFVIRLYKRGQITSRVGEFDSLDGARNAALKLVQGESI